VSAVLIACESSGTVSEAFRARGFDAWSCDLLPSDDGSEWHIQGDALAAIRSRRWALVIGHPPCTYLSVSGLHWNARRPGRAEKTEKGLQFVREMIDAARDQGAALAIENPVSCISSRIRKPDQIIQPWQFGHDASKATCLWLWELPTLRPTQHVAPRMVCGCGYTFREPAEDLYGCANCAGKHAARPRWANQTDSGQNRLPPSADRWKERSKTYQGIADAMAAQWGPWLSRRAAA
jgi:hypothetical protein